MLGYLFERLIKPVPDGRAAALSGLEQALADELDAAPVGERLETMEERLEAEANASYGDELYHGRRMAGLSTLKFEGDGSVRGLRNAAVSLGYVLPLEEAERAAEPAQDYAVRAWQEEAEGVQPVHVRAALRKLLEFDDPGLSKPALGKLTARDFDLDATPDIGLGRDVERAAPEPVAPTHAPVPLEEVLPDEALLIPSAAEGAPRFFTTATEGKLVFGPASQPALADIALFLADEEPETFEFFAPEERDKGTAAEADPAEDEAMVELLMAEVMREIYDENEALDLLDQAGDGTAQDDAISDHLPGHTDLA